MRRGINSAWRHWVLVGHCGAEPEDLPEELIFRVYYLGGNMRDIALDFSRPGGQVVCQYYWLCALGQGGLHQDPWPVL